MAPRVDTRAALVLPALVPTVLVLSAALGSAAFERIRSRRAPARATADQSLVNTDGSVAADNEVDGDAISQDA